MTAATSKPTSNASSNGSSLTLNIWRLIERIGMRAQDLLANRKSDQDTAIALIILGSSIRRSCGFAESDADKVSNTLVEAITLAIKSDTSEAQNKLKQLRAGPLPAGVPESDLCALIDLVIGELDAIGREAAAKPFVAERALFGDRSKL